MAQSTIRFAANAGFVAVSLLILSPFPALAVADKGGSGGHSRDDDRGNRSNGRGNVLPRPGPDLVNDISGGLDFIGDPTPSVEGPSLMKLGTDSNDLETLAVSDSVENLSITDAPSAMRSAAVAGEPPSVNVSGAAPRSGSDHVGAPTASVGSPRVVVGNGRSPGLQDRGSESLRGTSALEVVPAVPAAIEVTLPPLPPPLPPVERIAPPLLVVGELGTAKVDTTTDPLFGLAGLILIPAIGAALGYRQARAAQAVRESAIP